MRKPCNSSGPRRQGLGLFSVTILVALSVFSAPADQVRMSNGDQYFGHVVSVDSGTVVLQSPVLGELRLPRAKVSFLTFGTTPAASAAAAMPTPALPSQARTNSAAAGMALSGLGKQTNLIARVRSQFLAGAGPEANAKFDELLTGLMSGQLSMSDLRTQARAAAAQLQAAKKELGPEAGDMLDSYMAILDRFLKESDSETAPALAPAPQPQPPQARAGVK
jgi:hypothetical protein